MNNKITVAHLLPPYNPFPPTYAAGTELRVEQVALRQQRYRPVVVCGAFPGQALVEEMRGATIRRIRFGRVYRRLFQKITRLDPWPYVARMWRIIKEEQARLIHIHNEPKLLAGLAPYLRKEPYPLVVHVANEKPIPQHAVGLVTHWVACSEYIKQWLELGSGVPAGKISVIYTGVDTERRRPWWELSRVQRMALRRRFGVEDDNALVIVFAARLIRDKGVAELLDAFTLLRQRLDRPVMLLVAGNVRESNDPANEKAVYGKAMTARMTAMQGVKWVGSLAPARVHEFLQTGDLFMLPALWHDPFPTSLLEAAAAGIPILASDRGGIPELLAASPIPCLLHDPENPRYLCDKMAELLLDEARRRTLGGWLRRRVEDKFSWERVTQDFETLYDELLRPA